MIQNGSNQNKKQSSKKIISHTIKIKNLYTPPHHLWRRTTQCKLNKMKKKDGYDYFSHNESEMMQSYREEFCEKTRKYLGGKKHAMKNQNRFDKMKKKSKLNFVLQRNPVLVSL